MIPETPLTVMEHDRRRSIIGGRSQYGRADKNTITSRISYIIIVDFREIYLALDREIDLIRKGGRIGSKNGPYEFIAERVREGT